MPFSSDLFEIYSELNQLINLLDFSERIPRKLRRGREAVDSETQRDNGVEAETTEASTDSFSNPRMEFSFLHSLAVHIYFTNVLTY